MMTAKPFFYNPEVKHCAEAIAGLWHVESPGIHMRGSFFEREVVKRAKTLRLSDSVLLLRQGSHLAGDTHVCSVSLRGNG
jgi:hypothetical protein